MSGVVTPRSYFPTFLSCHFAMVKTHGNTMIDLIIHCSHLKSLTKSGIPHQPLGPLRVAQAVVGHDIANPLLVGRYHIRE